MFTNYRTAAHQSQVQLVRSSTETESQALNRERLQHHALLTHETNKAVASSAPFVRGTMKEYENHFEYIATQMPNIDAHMREAA